MLHNGERKKGGIGRLPVERAHGEIVVLSLPNSRLLGKILEGIECVAGIEFCVSVFRQKSRMALGSRADSGLNPLITESHGGQNGMRAGTA